MNRSVTQKDSRSQCHICDIRTLSNGQAFGLAVKMLVFQIKVPVFIPQLWFLALVSFYSAPCEAAVIAQTVGFLIPMWETSIEFLFPGFGPSPTSAVCRLLGVWTNGWEYYIFVSLYLPT